MMDESRDGGGGTPMVVAAGRKKMLERRMQELKRFDSGEFFAEATKKGRSSATDAAKLLRPAYGMVRPQHGPIEASGLRHTIPTKDKVEQQKQQQQQGGGRSASSGRYSRPSGSSDYEDEEDVTEFKPEMLDQMSLQQKSGGRNIEQQDNNNSNNFASEQARRVLLRRKIRHVRKFDSGDWARDVQSEEEMVGRGPRKPQLHVETVDNGSLPAPPMHRDGSDEVLQSDDHEQLSENGEPRRKSSVVAKRFLQKKMARKRFDSGDYNALLSSGMKSPDAKPDLDLLSVSSAETKYDSDVGRHESIDSLNGFRYNRLSPTNEDRRLCHRSKSSLSLLKRATSNDAAQFGRTSYETEDEIESHQKELEFEAQAAGGDNARSPEMLSAQKRLNNQKRTRRFDSADFFLGLSPPSSECDYDTLSPPATYRKTTRLGKSTLIQREIRAQKLKQREQDFQVS